MKRNSLTVMYSFNSKTEFDVKCPVAKNFCNFDSYGKAMITSFISLPFSNCFLAQDALAAIILSSSRFDKILKHDSVANSCSSKVKYSTAKLIE